MTPEQEDQMLNLMRPLFPKLDTEQLRQTIRQVVSTMPAGEDVKPFEEQLLKQFPNLADLFKTR